MKKYLYFVIPIIILLMMVLSFSWIYPNKEDVNSVAINEVINEIPESNNENINVLEKESTSPEILEKEELVKESEPEVVTNKNEKSTTSSPVSDASTKTTHVSKKETPTESIKKEEDKVEDKKEETKPSLPETQEPITKKEDSPISNDITKTEEVKKEETIDRCTTEHNHSIGVGNCGKWYASTSEGIAEYNSIILSWGTKWENFEIDNDTYYANCPSGYQYIDCMYCGKYTFDYYYRKVEK